MNERPEEKLQIQPEFGVAVTIRSLQPDDSLEALTDLLHRAYAPLAADGMRYLASHQSVEVTRCRAEKGECYVAVLDGERIVGTITFIPADVPDECPYYKRPDVAWCQQFAVEPTMQGRGVGAMLMDVVECRAREIGAKEVALDTSERATKLIETYRKRGYEIVERYTWDVTNYDSVIMRKTL